MSFSSMLQGSRNLGVCVPPTHERRRESGMTKMKIGYVCDRASDMSGHSSAPIFIAKRPSLIRLQVACANAVGSRESSESQGAKHTKSAHSISVMIQWTPRITSFEAWLPRRHHSLFVFDPHHTFSAATLVP